MATNLMSDKSIFDKLITARKGHVNQHVTAWEITVRIPLPITIVVNGFASATEEAIAEMVIVDIFLPDNNMPRSVPTLLDYGDGYITLSVKTVSRTASRKYMADLHETYCDKANKFIKFIK